MSSCCQELPSPSCSIPTVFAVLIETLKATSHSTIFDIPMRPCVKIKNTVLPVKEGRSSRDGNYSFELSLYGHPSQLSVPEVPTAIPPRLQPYWLKI